MQTPFQVVFLGTGTSGGVPLVGCDCHVCQSDNVYDKRLRSSLLIKTDNTTVVIDATPDFRQQMLRLHIRKLDALVLTHPHKDHIGGIDDTRPFQYFTQQPTQVYGSAMSLEGVKREIPYAFAANPYPGVPVLQLHEINESPFSIGDIQFTPIKVWHHKMPVLGFRIGDFTYITDANSIEPAEIEKIKGSHTLVINALRKEKHISHFTLQEAIAMVQKTQVDNAFFTHISHQLGRHHDINQELPQGMQLAHDGMLLQF